VWNANWYLQGGGGTTGVVLLSAEAVLMEPIEGELVATILDAELVASVLEAELVPALEAEVE